MAFQHTKAVQNAAFMPLFRSGRVRHETRDLAFLPADA